MPEIVSIGNVKTPGTAEIKTPSFKTNNENKMPQRISENATINRKENTGIITAPKNPYTSGNTGNTDITLDNGAAVRFVKQQAAQGAAVDNILSQRTGIPQMTLDNGAGVQFVQRRESQASGDNQVLAAGNEAVNNILSAAERNKAIRDSYEQTGGVVDAAQYMSERGIPGGIRYDTESDTVNMGSMPVETEYVSDGKAYVSRENADRAINAYKENSNLVGNQEVLNNYNSEYDGRIQKRLDDVTDYGDFNYNPDTDPAYQAYREQYIREADEAFERQMDKARRSAYGSSGANLAQALAARDANLKKITDAIPQFQNDAYERYKSNYGITTDKLDRTRQVAEDAYNKMYQQNRDTYSDLMQNNTFNLNRQITEAQAESQRIDNDYGRRQIVQLNQAIDQAATSGALARGYYTENDTQYAPWLSAMLNDGTFRIGPGGRIVDANGNDINIYDPVQRYASAESIGQNTGQYWYDQVTANTPNADEAARGTAAQRILNQENGEQRIPDYDYWMNMSVLPQIPITQAKQPDQGEIGDKALEKQNSMAALQALFGIKPTENTQLPENRNVSSAALNSIMGVR